MSIIHVRIDDRLIHGQVATMWTSNLSATRIMVIDDEAANNDITKMSLKLATPNGVSLSVLPVEKAAMRLNENAYEGQRVFVIVKSPDTLEKLLDLNVDIKQVNVGNLTYTAGKTKVTATVAITEEEYKILNVLKDHGVKVTLQLIPANPSEDFFDVAQKKFGGEG